MQPGFLYNPLMLPTIRRLTLPFLCAIALPVHAGKVVGIADGDTLTVLQDRKQVKVRLANIDAPEKEQAFGSRSRQSLSDLCFGRHAELDVQTVDRYGRTVAVVSCDGVNANAAQVKRGMAWVYSKYNKDPTLKLLEGWARLQREGLWSEADPTPPWDWRKASRKQP